MECARWTGRIKDIASVSEQRPCRHAKCRNYQRGGGADVNCSPHDEHRQSDRGVIALASVPTILEPHDGQSGRDESCGAMESSLGVAVLLGQLRWRIWDA
jgi:hypothetical protein